MHDFNGMGWGMGFGWVVGLIVLIVIVWLVVKSINQNNNSNQPKNMSALDILNERYAHGEIDKEEYDERKRNIL